MTDHDIDSATAAIELVDARWTWLRGQTTDYPYLSDLLDAVGLFPQLAVLFPFLSVGRLCFSRCTEFPYYVDFLIAFWNGSYRAEATLERGGWTHTKELGRGSAREALAIIHSRLPPDYGPARLGNADLLFTQVDGRDLARAAKLPDSSRGAGG